MRNIFLFDIIDKFTAELIIRNLLYLDRESDEEITMFINSPGGSITALFAILDTMSVVKSPIRTVVLGMAASCAAVLAASGNTRLIAKTSQIMIHEASWYAEGTTSTIKERAELLETYEDKLVDVLSKKTFRPANEIKDMIWKKDKYFEAQDAVAFGLVDRIMNDDEAQILKLSESTNVEGYEIVDDKEIQMLREGKYSHPIYGDLVISESSLNKMKENFDKNVRGVDISIDYTHDNETGESPAAFWIKSLEVRGNSDGKGKGLFARGEFTPMGAKKISEKEYKYSSADFAIDYIDQSGKHHPYVLRGGTLTNRPFIKNMNPIKLSESLKTIKKEKTMDKEQLIAALRDTCGLDVAAIQSESEASAVKVKELEAKIVELSALPADKEAEIKALKDSLAEAESKISETAKMSSFNKLVEQGKVVTAQKDKIMERFSSAEEIDAFYADAPAVVSTKAAGNSDEVNEDLTAEEKQLVASGEYTKEQIIEGRSPVLSK